MTHRGYAFTGDYIRISMYDDRLEILSPGKLPNTVTLDNMRETRYSRNPRIARTLVEFGWVRELNEGVKRIYTEMQSMLLNDPVFSEPDDSGVQLTLENNIVTRTLRQRDALQDRVPCEVLEGLGEYDLAAVRAAYARGRVTTKDLAGMIGRSTRSASTVLKALDTRSVLVWHGTSRNDPAQYYSLGWGHGEISDHFGVTSEPESPTGSRRLLKLQVGMPPVPTSVSNGGSKATSE